MVRIFICMLCLLSFLNSAHTEENKKLHIYNWANFVSPEVLKEFKRREGVTVIYDVFDSEEMLDAKLVSGSAGYDLVFPAASQFLANQIKVKLYHKIDTSKLTNYKGINPNLLKLLSVLDPGNQYSVPVAWTAVAIGYDISKIKKIDPEAPTNSLEILFNPKYAEKFSKCGVVWFNSSIEMVGLALIYNGYDPNDITEEKLEVAEKTLKSVRKYVKHILSSDSYADTLANSSACIAVGWVGDLAQGKERIPLNTANVKYDLPREGTFVSMDVMAIPASSANVESAHKLIDLLLDPKFAAINSNYTKYMNSNMYSHRYMDKKLTSDPSINLSPEILAKSYGYTVQPLNIVRKRTRIWSNILTGAE